MTIKEKQSIPIASAIRWARFLEERLAFHPLKSSPKHSAWHGLNRKISSFVARVLVRNRLHLCSGSERTDPAFHWPCPLEVRLASLLLGLLLRLCLCHGPYSLFWLIDSRFLVRFLSLCAVYGLYEQGPSWSRER